MKHIVSALLIAALLVSCLTLSIFAEEETTEEASAQEPNRIVFNAELTGKKNIIMSTHDLAKGSGGVSKSGEWQGIKIEIENSEDPHIGLDITKFFNRFSFEPLTVEAAPFIVLKVMADEIAFDDFELYYCAGNVLSYAEEYRTGSDYAIDAGNGELYFVYDLTGDAEGAYSMFRVDIHNPEVGALMYLTDIVFFANEEAALEWCGYYNQPTTEATTEEVTEEVTETEEENTKAPATTEAKTEKVEEKGGCGSVIGAGFVTLSLLALGVACTKKKD